jgi:ABC-type multidrug transport system fused ATPase/permease subunit
MTFQTYRQLLIDYLKPQWLHLIGLTIALFSHIALQIINPQILGEFIDLSVRAAPIPQLYQAAGQFMIIALFSQAAAILTSYLGETLAWQTTNALRLDLVAHCLKLDLTFHQTHPPGELLERVDGDVTLLARFFSQLIIQILGSALLLVGILVTLLWKNPFAGLCLTGFATGALGLLFWLQPQAIKPWGEFRQVRGEFYGMIGEHISCREDLRANGAIGYVMHQFYQVLRRWLPLYQKARFASTVLWFSSVGIFTAGNAIALVIAAYLWHQQAISIGAAYLIFHYTNLLAQPIEQIREELEQLQQVGAAIERIHKLRQQRSWALDQSEVTLSRHAKAITWHQVCFRYNRACPDLDHVDRDQPEWTLQDISFHLPARHTLGLIGHTGCGKSTIARLLLRLYDHQAGEIRFDNYKIEQIAVAQLRQHIGFVTQDVQIFQATVRDNLTFFDPMIADQQILSVLADLGLMPWLERLPEGLNSWLSPSALSAGQAQTLALARVFLKNPGLIILDEASARLDPKMERLMAATIDRLLHDRTAIIIAHRLDTIQRVDQILMLEQGRILEYGERRQLANNPHSHFAQLLQSATIED